LLPGGQALVELDGLLPTAAAGTAPWLPQRAGSAGGEQPAQPVEPEEPEEDDQPVYRAPQTPRPQQQRMTPTPFADMPSFNEQDTELPAFLRRNVPAR